MSKKMVKCKACGNEIAKSAKVCPNCGKKNKKPLWQTILVIFGIIIVIGIFAGKGGGSSDNETVTDSQDISVTVESNTINDIPNNYRLIDEKLGKSGFVYHKIEIYVATDREYGMMADFSKARGKAVSNSDTLYRAVFFDDEKFAVLPEGPVQSEYWENDNLKHMVGKYTKNFINDFEEFLYWESNAYEGVTKELH